MLDICKYFQLDQPKSQTAKCQICEKDVLRGCFHVAFNKSSLINGKAAKHHRKKSTVDKINVTTVSFTTDTGAVTLPCFYLDSSLGAQ